MCLNVGKTHVSINVFHELLSIGVYTESEDITSYVHDSNASL